MTKYFQNFYGTFNFFKKIKWPTRDAANISLATNT